MNKGITFYFGYNIPKEERIKIIKDAGFDCVITSGDKKFSPQNGTIKQQVELFKQNGIKNSSLHMRYDNRTLKYFWQKGLKGKILERKLVNDVKTAKKYNFTCVVVHLWGEPNIIGLERLKRVLKICEKLDVDLAIENINDNRCFKYVFKNIDNKHLKFCYDSGHANVWEKEDDILNKYLDKLITLHLHDNNGLKDQHTLNKYGTINWQYIALAIAKLNRSINLDYEILMHYRGDETPKEVVNETYKQALCLEEMIKKEKELLKK